MKTIRIGMAGFGKGGQIYNAPIIDSIEEMEITSIFTSSEANIAAAQSAFPKATVVHKFDEILKDPNIDLVVITTPNHLHKKFAEKALKAGKHVVVEKPITPTVEEADKLISLANKSNLILSVHHNRRWDSDFLTLKKIIAANTLGAIRQYEAHFDRFRSEVALGWKEDANIPGSGILYDLGSHLIDQALQLFGTPKEIYADIQLQRKGAKVADTFELLLYYPNLKVSLNAGMMVKVPGPKFILHGNRGSFVKYGEDPQEEMLKSGQKPNGLWGWGIEPNEFWGKYSTEEDSGTIESEEGNYRLFYKNIYHAITGQEELEVKPEQARDVIKIIELAIQSSTQKCRVPFE